MSEPNYGTGGEENTGSTATIESSDSGNQQTQSLLSRIGNWFRRSGNGHGGMSAADVHIIDRPHGGHGEPGNAIEARSSFLRPWARRDAAIGQLQEGFNTLTDLMSSVRDHLDRQSKRQDELIGYLSHLPQALEQLPESNRAHGEALKAIHQQLTTQNGNQEKLSEILEKLNTKGLEDREVLDEVRDRVETMRQTDQAIADNLTSVGTAMQSITRNGETTSQVLEQMRDNLDSRDGQLERILHRQGTRFTTMLAIAIFLSVAALVAVSVIGYLLLYKP
jgi:uncharacterized phage infection (PIP) family protein YhgE